MTGLLGMIILSSYKFEFLGLIISYPFALWFAGKRLGEEIEWKLPSLEVRIRYSVIVNSIIWSVFLLIDLITSENLDFFFGWIFLLVIIFFCMLFTPITIGKIIYSVVRKRIKRF